MFELNEEMWPLVKLTWRSDNDKAADNLTGLHHLLKRQQAHVFMVELPPLAPFELKKLFKAQRQWQACHELALKELCLGMVFTSNTLAGQAAINAYLRLQPAPFPTKVVETMAEAFTWAQARFVVESLRFWSG